MIIECLSMHSQAARIPSAISILKGSSGAVVRMDRRSQTYFRAVGEACIQTDASGNCPMALGILAGGVATRFGRSVKATAEVGELSGRKRNFLEVKSAHALWATRRYGQIIQVLMTSFVTDEAITRDERLHRYYGLRPDRTWHSVQPFIPACYRRVPAAQRLRREVESRIASEKSRVERRHLQAWLAYWTEQDRGRAGQPIVDSEGRKMHHPSGSFEAIPALIRDGTLLRLLQNSVTYLGITNLDNFGVTVEPALLGLLEASGKAALVEGVERRPGDIGAWIGVREDGKARFVEKSHTGGFRRGYAQFANTSSWIIHLHRFMRELGLNEAELRDSSPSDLQLRVDDFFKTIPWRDVVKTAQGATLGAGSQFRPVSQRERFLSDLSLVNSTIFVQTDRRKRYFPVKQREDIANLTPKVKALLEEQLLFADS